LIHGHWDHVGCAAEMKKLTGAPLAMHQSERERTEKHKNFRLAFVIIIRYHDNMIRTQISVDESLYRRAKLVARRKGISLAELCRRSLEQTVAREPTDKPWAS
jgi:glyoxylase-like metal-dependent hydrolase (beta-lactamase superfamily II)